MLGDILILLVRALTGGAKTPIDHFSFIDDETRVVRGAQARAFANRAIDVDRFTAIAADQMVVVVAHAILVAGRGTGRLDAPDQSLIGQ